MPSDPITFLFALPRFAASGAAAYKPGLERMRALLAAMGDPHAGLSTVHVAGTNGKGSTASLVAAALTAAGRRTGLHTSPHLLDVTERMRVDGRPAARDWLAEAVARYRPALETLQPSFFEATVALSLRYFAEQEVDVAVVEVGLGGRLDATNVVQPVACGITHIGLDHTDLLGDTVAAIAREKAGIAKPGVPLFSNATQPDARAAIADTAAAAGAPFHDVRAEVHADAHHTPAGWRATFTTPIRTYRDLPLSLPGTHQIDNAALALRLVEHVLPSAPTDALRTAWADVPRWSGLRGRSERIAERPAVVLDVAHNADGLQAALANAHAACGAGGRLVLALGLMRDKDARAVAEVLRSKPIEVWTVSLDGERGLDADALADLLGVSGVPAEAVGTVEAAEARFRMAAHPDDALLVAGSHQMVSAWLSAFGNG